VAVNLNSKNRIFYGGPLCRGRGSSGWRPAGAAAFVFLIILLAGYSVAQPQATFRPSPKTVPLNRLLRVTLEIVWAGEADVYDIPQPDLSGLPEFAILERSLSATRKGDENLMKYEFVMKPLKEGEYDLDRMVVKYYEKGVDIPTDVVLPQTIVRVLPGEIVPRKAKIALSVGALVAAAALAGFLAVRAKKSARKSKADASEAGGRKRESLLAELSGAASLRIEGEMGAYMEKLFALADSDELRPHVDRIEDLRDLTENVKFAGLAPSPDQLRWAEKLVKKAIKMAFPEEEAEEDQP